MHRFSSILLPLLVMLPCLMLAQPRAIGQENSVNTTVKELAGELKTRTKNLKNQEGSIDQFLDRYASTRKTAEENLKEISVVLYSLDQNNMFTLAFFCKQIAELKSGYEEKKFPSTKMNRLIDNEISQLSNLSAALGKINSSELTEEGIKAKEDTLASCSQIEENMKHLRSNVTRDEKQMHKLLDKINAVDAYAKNQMDEMMKRMFIEPSSSFPGTSASWKAFVSTIKTTYLSSNELSERMIELRAIWMRVTTFLLCSYALVLGAFILIQKAIAPPLVRKVSTERRFYILGGTILLLAGGLFLSHYFQTIPFINSTINIAAEFMVLSAMIFLSITARLKRDQIATGIKFYLPSIHLCMIFIFLRICMAPNIAVNFLTPIILTLIAFYQIIVLIKYKNKLDRIDRGFGSTTLILFILSALFSWGGYSYMAIIINLVWIMLMSSILIMLAFRHLLHKYQEKRSSRSQNANKLLGPFISKLLFPLLSVIMIIYSCLWPAGIFDITHIISEWSNAMHSIPQIVSSLSFKGIATMIIVGIVLNYVIFITGSIVRDIYQDSYETAAAATYVTLGTLFLWTLFSIVSLACLGVNFNGILVVMGGMSMGIGFALKDTIDNLISGLSLVFGRLKQGDVVECDGIRGKVSSIGFRTTFIETLDGSIIGFLNSQLFNKNFRNLTKNHLYESVKVEIGIAYGSDVQKAREIILEAVRQVDSLPRSRTTSVILDNFGDNSVNLGVWVWVPVRNKPSTLSRVRECIYEAFNENGISIPFPQQDVYIKEIPGKAAADREK